MEQAAQTLTVPQILLPDRKPLHSVKMFYFHSERDNFPCRNLPPNANFILCRKSICLPQCP